MEITTTIQSSAEADIIFERVNENLAKVITTRGGKTFEQEMFVFSDKDYDEIVKLQAKIYRLRQIAEKLKTLK